VDSMIIEGKQKLCGRVRISSSKNCALPLISASLLTEEEVVIEDVPDLLDIRDLLEVISEMGVSAECKENNLFLDSSAINSFCGSFSLSTKFRASVLLLGPLLTRFGKARIPFPGGCSIGSRPIDLHWKGLASMGVELACRNGYIDARAKRLYGNHIYLDFPSVGATENIMMAATMAQGETIIENAALEPEIVELSVMLTAMGANISGAGTPTIRIKGVSSLHGVRHRVIPDRIEAGTYMIAAAITGGTVTVDNVIMEHIKPLTTKLEEAGVQVIEQETGVVTVISPEVIKAVDIETMPYPGFPTDLQPIYSSLMTQAGGTGKIKETVFEDRFRHAKGLARMGAEVRINGQDLIIDGGRELQGRQVRAYDLRGGAALMLAALVAKGKSEIQDVYHLDRGYEKLELKINSLGGRIHRRAFREEQRTS